MNQTDQNIPDNSNLERLEKYTLSAKDARTVTTLLGLFSRLAQSWADDALIRNDHPHRMLALQVVALCEGVINRLYPDNSD